MKKIAKMGTAKKATAKKKTKLPVETSKPLKFDQVDFMRNKRRSARDIGPIPDPDPKLFKLRERGAIDPEKFLRDFLPEMFPLPFSKHHVNIIEDVGTAFLNGGLYAQVLPRGTGKSTLTLGLSSWATLYAYLRFLVLIAATKDLALNISESLLSMLKTHIPFIDAFPEICYPFSRLEHVNQASGQISNGMPTRLSARNEQIIFPTIPGSPASGTIIRPYGLDGAIRGVFKRMPDNTILRPDGFLLDDPQTDESAMSVAQCDKREKLISSSILGLAGPNKAISGVVNGTVIRSGDLMDRFFQENTPFPEFVIRKVQFLESWPENKDLWGQYLAIRKNDKGPKWPKSNKFYRANRPAMDQGALAYWDERRELNAISAIQSAYNLIYRIRMPAFMAEHQQEPTETTDGLTLPKREDIYNMTNNLKMRQISAEVQYLTAGIDVHKKVLYYAVVGWSDGGTGQIVEYGTWPRQPIASIDVAAPPVMLESMYKGTESAIIRQGIIELTNILKSTKYTPINNLHPIPLMKAFGDAGYKPTAVYDAKKQLGEIMEPSRGIGITASRKPISQYVRKPGERFGHHWYYPTVRKTRDFPHCAIDVNYWKDFITGGVFKTEGTPGCLSVFGDKLSNHDMFADHFTCETYTETEGHGRRLNEWKKKPGRTENHLFDCVIYSAAAASKCGMSIDSDEAKKPPPKAAPKTGKSKFQELKEQRLKSGNNFGN